jgi:hypothetical protein
VGNRNALELGLELVEHKLFAFFTSNKQPLAGSHGFQDATDDPGELEALYRAYGGTGVAVLPGAAGYVVLDVDVKEGKRGKTQLGEIEQYYGSLNGAVVVSTPSGGLHIWLKKPFDKKVSNSPLADVAGNIYDAIDIRADGGYVMAPGNPGYEVVRGEWPPIATIECPESLFEAFDDSSMRGGGTWRDYDPSDSDIDPETRAFANYLLTLGFKNPTKRWAGKIATVRLDRPDRARRGSSVSIGYKGPGVMVVMTTSLEIDGQVFKAGSGWELDQFKAHLAGEGIDSHGVQHHRAEKRKVALRDRIKSLADIENIPSPHWLVDGLLQRNSIAFLTADPNIGKTFLAVDWACHIITGKPWQDKTVESGKVMYVIAEGGYGFGDRTKGWRQEHQVAREEIESSFYFFDEAIYLDSEPDVAELVELADELKPDLIVIDTYSRSAPRADTDSGGPDAKIIIDHLHQIKEASGACILALDHPGKADKATIRGSVAQQGAVDTHLYLQGAPTDPVITVYNHKQRNGRLHEPFKLLRKVIDLEEGGTTCVIDTAEGVNAVDEDSDFNVKVSDSVMRCAKALGKIHVTSGSTNQEWFRQAQLDGVTKRMGHFDGLRQKAIEVGLVRKVGERMEARYWVTERFQNLADGFTVNLSNREVNSRPRGV